MGPCCVKLRISAMNWLDLFNDFSLLYIIGFFQRVKEKEKNMDQDFNF